MATAVASQSFTGVSPAGIIISPTTNPSINTDPISISIWLYFTDPQNVQSIFTQLGGTGTSRTFLYESVSKLFTQLGGGNNSGAPNTFTLNTWQHISLSFAGGTANVKCYINGVLDIDLARTGEAANGNLKFFENAAGTNEWNDTAAYGIVYIDNLSVEALREVMFQPFAFSNIVWMPDFLEPASAGTGYRDLSPDQNGVATVNGTTPTNITDGPPVYLLGGQ